MENSATFRTVSRRSVQLAVLATVAAVGVSVGRWVVPEGSGTAASYPPSAVLGAQQAPVSQNPAQRAVLPAGLSPMERKLERMDAQDDRLAPASQEPAQRAVLPAGLSPMERKLERMDAQDDRLAPASQDPAQRAVLPAGLSPMERKLAQMDAEDAR